MAQGAASVGALLLAFAVLLSGVVAVVAWSWLLALALGIAAVAAWNARRELRLLREQLEGRP